MSNLIKSHCIKNKITLSELSSRCQISTSYLSLIANGKRVNITEDFLSRLSKKLGVSVKTLQTSINQESSKEHHPRLEVTNAETECLSKVLSAVENDNLVEFKLIISSLDNDSCLLKYNLECWYQALLYGNENNFDKALEQLFLAEKFIAASRMERKLKARILNGIGCVYVAKCDYKSALRFFRLSLYSCDEGEQAALVYLNLGTLYKRLGQVRNAIESYSRAEGNGTPSIRIIRFI